MLHTSETLLHFSAKKIKMRVIKQIVATAFPGEHGGPDIAVLFALCDDGSMWRLWDATEDDSKRWKRIEDIPQED